MRKTLIIALIAAAHVILTYALNVADFNTGFGLRPSPTHPFVEAARHVVEFPLLLVSLALDPRQYLYQWAIVPNSLLWALAILFGVRRVRGTLRRQPA